SRLEKELESLENGDLAPSTKETLGEMAEEEQKAANAQKETRSTPGCPAWEVTLFPILSQAERPISNSPMKSVEGSSLMKAAMYSVEITVEKDKVTGETKVLSSTTLLPKHPCLQGVKVYEDEMKGTGILYPTPGTGQLGGSPAESKECSRGHRPVGQVYLPLAPELGRAPRGAGAVGSARLAPTLRPALGSEAAQDEQTPPVVTPGRALTQTCCPLPWPVGSHAAPRLGLRGVLWTGAPRGAGAEPGAPRPPKGSAGERAGALPLKEDSQAGEKPGANDTEPKGADQDMDMKKQRCKCCTVM
uniref:Paralemmin-1 n=1 Tax=Pelodiscus sinensis TaxID=13735 RepID=K7G694_PELSI